MSTQGLVRTAVVGAGLASLTFHVPLILALPNVFHLHTVVERKPPADKEGGTIGQKFGVPVKVVTSFEEALADQEIELVVLGTPNATHYPLAKAALEAGKHVLVDKPIAPTFAECEELLALSKKVNRVLYAFQNRRWDSDFLTLLKVVQTGKLGTLIEFESHFDRFRNKLRGYWRELPAPGSGMTYDLGSHLIDQALVLFGRPDKVTAFIENVRRLGQDEVDDSFTIIFHYNPTPENQHPRKAILRAHSLSLRSPQLRYVLRGTTGSFIKTGLDPQEDQVKAGISATSSEFGVESTDIQGVLEVLDGEKTLQTRVPSERGVYTQLYSNLAAAIREGAPLAVKWEEASAVIQIIELAHQSSKEGRSIDVPSAA